MKLALREMRRRPGRFVAAFVILTLVSTLVVYLGGLIDGTVKGGTGALRAQPGQLLVFSDQSRSVIPDSRIDAATRADVEGVDGVAGVAGLGIAQLGARLPDAGPRDLIDVALVGYELPGGPLTEPPPPGQVDADESLRSDGIREGTMLLLGPERTPVEVRGFVQDTTFDGQGTLWSSLDTWRTVQNANRPARAVGADGQQVLVIQTDDPVTTASDIDRATATTETITPGDAVRGLPGVDGTRSVFTAVIVITIVIGAVIVALLFGLLVLERVALYGVLKALGVRSSTLLASLTVQATALALLAAAVGTALGAIVGQLATSGANAFDLTPARVLVSAGVVLAAALLGAAVTLRRVLRIDPAAAIGSAT